MATINGFAETPEMALIRPAEDALAVLRALEARGACTDDIDRILETVHRAQDEAGFWPHGATVCLANVEDKDVLGWASRDVNGNLVTAYGGYPVPDPERWFVQSERPI